MSRQINSKIFNRIIFIQAFLFILIILLGIKAVEIQIFQAPVLSSKAEKEYMGYISARGKRGEILDRNQKKLSTSLDAVSVAASPVDVKDTKKTADLLASALKLDKQVLIKKLSGGKNFTWIKKKLSSIEADKVRELNLKGIFF